MNTEITNAVMAADNKAQYDEYAKRLLAQKSILAHILVKTVDEFRGMAPRDVVKLIEGEPEIGIVPVEPGLTNVEKRTSGGERVVSIWICMNMEENSMNHYHLMNEVLLGNQRWEGKEDAISIVLLGLSKKLPEHDETLELHRLLGTLLSNSLTQREKLNIIEKEYDIPIEDDFRKDVSVMCNLSQGVEEWAIEKTNIKIIMNMYDNNFTVEQIAIATSKTIEEVKSIIEKNQPVLV